MRKMMILAAAAFGLLGPAGAAFAQTPTPAPAPAAAPAAGDPAAGERVFAQCRACHQVGPTARNGVGPHLNGMFGRQAGSVAGFNYSDAYKRPEIQSKTWNEENFATYIRDPRGVTPGTRMVFNGLRNDDQIRNLTAYLKQFGADGVRTQ